MYEGKTRIKKPSRCWEGWCPGSELNRYGHCWPQDFLTASAFAAPDNRDSWSGLYLHHIRFSNVGALRLVSTPFTNMVTWLGITNFIEVRLPRI